MVDVELEDAVARIFLNRPEKANALSSAMLSALASALESLDLATLRVVVLAGRGRNFCGGADANELKALNPQTAPSSSLVSIKFAAPSAAFLFRWWRNCTAQ